MRRKVFAWLGVLLWVSLIFSLSSQSNPPGGGMVGGIPGGHGDLLVHAGEYFILALLLYVVTNTRGPITQTLLRNAVVISVAIMIGGVDEIYQSFVPGRTASLLDLSADTFGAVLAIALTVVAHRYRLGQLRRFGQSLVQRRWLQNPRADRSSS